MSAQQRPYYDPFDFGCFDLATSSVNKTFQFDWDTDVVAGAKVAVTIRGRTLRTYTVGSGLEITNANRTITLTLNGTDFEALGGERVQANCSFFVVGDVEVVFSIDIIESPL
jgi:hypothetical protein